MICVELKRIKDKREKVFVTTSVTVSNFTHRSFMREDWCIFLCKKKLTFDNSISNLTTGPKYAPELKNYTKSPITRWMTLAADRISRLRAKTKRRICTFWKKYQRFSNVHTTGGEKYPNEIEPGLRSAEKIEEREDDGRHDSPNKKGNRWAVGSLHTTPS